MGKLHMNVEVSVFFVGQEAGGQPAAEEESCCARGDQQHQHHGSLAKEHARPVDVASRDALEEWIEPVEEALQGSMALLLSAQEKSCQRRAESQRVECRQHNGDGDSHCELLIEPSCDSRNKRCGHKD